MKDKELYILYALNTEFPEADIKEDKFIYNRYDAYSKKTIIEIKDRNIFYENTMIEFDKFSYNLLYAQMSKKQFIYVVKMDQKIYVFNITKLVSSGYKFKWIFKELKKQTEFADKRKIKKLVGYININESVKEIYAK